MSDTWMTRETALFRGGPQQRNFREMAMIHPSRRITRSAHPRPLPVASGFELPETFEFENASVDTEAFLESVQTTGLMVVRDGTCLFQQHMEGYAPGTQTISFSVAKSFISTLIACALRDGHIRDIEDPVDRYAPALAGSGYAGVALRDVLQMSSGVRWNEDYADPKSDVARFAAAFERGQSFDAVAASLPREHVPGTFNRYNSCDTHVLGMVLAGATEVSVSEYLERELWHPLGMEDDCFFLVDGEGVEAAAMGMNASLRDYAKLGLLFLNDGFCGERQILPDGWVEACRTATLPHLKPGKRPNADYPFGYSYQWWLPDESGAFTAIGVYYQFIWIDRASGCVIAKTSADARFGRDNHETERIEQMHFALFNGIATDVSDHHI
ncbi:serine hydrolase [Erythrobacter westpacificensis]|uniref:Serine hydrolase n=1 Tax=Erythrobacter westpacificensis TaxID=1055231 RepID=A0ABP9K285_9SPHN